MRGLSNEYMTKQISASKFQYVNLCKRIFSSEILVTTMKKMTMKIWTQHDSDFTKCLMTPLFYWLHALLGICKLFKKTILDEKKHFLE